MSHHDEGSLEKVRGDLKDSHGKGCRPAVKKEIQEERFSARGVVRDLKVIQILRMVLKMLSWLLCKITVLCVFGGDDLRPAMLNKET